MDKYEPISLIGKGNFGSISKIRRISDGKILVWKELDYGKMDEKEKHHIVSEVNILRDLHHPNIVKYYDRIIDKKSTKIYIIMEYCPRGDLSQLIKRCKRSHEYISEDVIWKIFTQVLSALYACHMHKEGKILHRDIKPSNVFLDNENNVKLGDFGLSRMLSNESNFAYSNVGTPYYMSPEQIDENRYNEKSDIWSLGCCLYELTSLRPPFEATNHLSLALKIKAGKVQRIPVRYSDELNRVIMWMMTVNQDSRPSVENLASLPQISIRIKERKIKESYAKLKILEDNIRGREERVKEKEIELERREKYLDEREKMLKEKEEIFNNEMNIRKVNYIQDSMINNDMNSHNYKNLREMMYHAENNEIPLSNKMPSIDSMFNKDINYYALRNGTIETENFNINRIPRPQTIKNNFESSNHIENDNGNDADNSEMGSILYPPKPNLSIPISSFKDVYHKPLNLINSSFNSNTIPSQSNTLYSTHHNTQSLPITSQVSSQSSTVDNNTFTTHYVSHTTTNSHQDYKRYMDNNSIELPNSSKNRKGMEIDYEGKLLFGPSTTRGKIATPKRRIMPYGGTPSMTKYSTIKRESPRNENMNVNNRSYAIPRNNSYNFTHNNLVNTSYKKKNSYRGLNDNNRRINFDNFI